MTDLLDVNELMNCRYRYNKQRDLTRVPDGSKWQFVYPQTSPRHIAIATMRRGKLVIDQAFDLTSGWAEVVGAVGSVHDLPSPACRAVDPSSEYNGWLQWRWREDPSVTLGDVERGKVLLPRQERSAAIPWRTDGAA